MEPICSEAELQEFHPTRQMLGLAQQLVSQPLLSRVELNCLILEDASFESFDSLALRVGSHYFYQGLHSVYRLAVNRIGSLDELGNLSSAFSGLSGGIQQLYYEPRQGLVTSPRAFARGTLKGVGGLAGGVVGGTGIALFSFASAMGKHAGTLANAISMDSEWKHHRRAQQQRHAQSTRGGLLMGAQSLGQGLLEGGKGVFVKPVAGAMDDGARGFVKGLGTGLTLTLTPTRILILPYPTPNPNQVLAPACSASLPSPPRGWPAPWPRPPRGSRATPSNSPAAARAPSCACASRESSVPTPCCTRTRVRRRSPPARRRRTTRRTRRPQAQALGSERKRAPADCVRDEGRAGCTVEICLRERVCMWPCGSAVCVVRSYA